MRAQLSLTLVAAALASSAAGVHAQGGAPTITLDRGAREFAEPFSSVGAVVELRDGRLLVFDSREKELRLVDFARGTQVQAARTG